ncbi:zinc dependent phospholipase C family protein [Clostridium sp.]|uniref:zinc dependent phospholipase C family protein n=1 Tax=Clostridium sp. TaxID=1506 RepID=UPI002622FDFF|nr:zinc dependent phospholipase C family protein [uncultured Clostridium sp.]
MIVNTHILMSQILYKHISKDMNFKLDRVAFGYGNIKPDFNNKDINREHTLDESLYEVNKYSEELMSKDISIKEFSKSLGVICHFACDYFCLYHREGNEKKGVIEHMAYESILHVKLLAILLRGKLKLNNHEILEVSVENIALSLQEKYKSESNSLTKDITYALAGALQISELIVCSAQFNYQQKGLNIPSKYQLN